MSEIKTDNQTVPVMSLSDFDVSDVDWTAPGYSWMPVPELTVTASFDADVEPTEREKAIGFIRSLPKDMPVMVLTPRSRMEMNVAESLATDFEFHKEGQFNPFGAAYERMRDWAYNQDDLPDFPED
jgi:hypothetical protein